MHPSSYPAQYTAPNSDNKRLSLIHSPKSAPPQDDAICCGRVMSAKDTWCFTPACDMLRFTCGEARRSIDGTFMDIFPSFDQKAKKFTG